MLGLLASHFTNSGNSYLQKWGILITNSGNSILQKTVQGSATVYSDGNVSVEYMGAKARVYNSSNELVHDSSIFYNTSVTDGWTAISSKKTVPMGYYYSKGITYGYNGNGYTAYNTFATPLVYTSN